jgi:hypothetical protein
MKYDISPQVVARLNFAAKVRPVEPAQPLESLLADSAPLIPMNSPEKANFSDHFYFTASNKQLMK